MASCQATSVFGYCFGRRQEGITQYKVASTLWKYMTEYGYALVRILSERSAERYCPYWKTPGLVPNCPSIFKGRVVGSHYCCHRLFLPSMALCLLYLTVLSFSSQMVRYLLSVGLSSTQIGPLRTISTAVEITATWLSSIATNKVGPLRGGLWFISWQMCSLLGALGFFWVVDTPSIPRWS